MFSPVRPSVCMSVRLSPARNQKRVQKLDLAQAFPRAGVTGSNGPVRLEVGVIGACAATGGLPHE